MLGVDIFPSYGAPEPDILSAGKMDYDSVEYVVAVSSAREKDVRFPHESYCTQQQTKVSLELADLEWIP